MKSTFIFAEFFVSFFLIALKCKLWEQVVVVVVVSLFLNPLLDEGLSMMFMLVLSLLHHTGSMCLGGAPLQGKSGITHAL